MNNYFRAIFWGAILLLLVGCGERPDASTVSEQTDSIQTDAGEVNLGPNATEFSLGGYTSAPSVVQGGTIDIHISTDESDPFDVRVWREGTTSQLMTTIENVTATEQNCAGDYTNGCDFDVATSLTIPTNWPSGTYSAGFPTSEGELYLLFWVRENVPASTSDALLITPYNTYVAYNGYGGKSLYGFNSDNDPAAKLSLKRPFANKSGTAEYFSWDSPFVEWAEAEGYTLEYATDYDLHFTPALLDDYRVLIISGHSEYWTWEMRQRVKAFVAAGGRVINLSGNTMWWQIRFEQAGDVMVGYKDAELDPELDPMLNTAYAWDYPIYDAESAIIGSSFLMGGYFPRDNITEANGYGGYWMQQPEHWVFDGMDIGFYEQFGTEGENPPVNYEIDGMRFNCDENGQLVTGPITNGGTPDNYNILAITPVGRQGRLLFGTIGIYTNAQDGAVFSPNSIGWASGLSDPNVSQITSNVLTRFLDSTPLPQEEVTSSNGDYFFRDNFNCHRLEANGLTSDIPEWDTVTSFNYYEFSSLESFDLTASCGSSGSGLRLSILPDTSPALRTMIRPNWEPSDTVYRRFVVDFSDLSMQDDDTFELTRLYHDPRSESRQRLSRLIVGQFDGQLQIQYRGHSGENGWVDVPSERPFLLETLWDQPNNKMTLWIDDASHEFDIDLSDLLGINQAEIVFTNASETVSGAICIDEYGLAAERIIDGDGDGGGDDDDDDGEEPPDSFSIYLPYLQR